MGAHNLATFLLEQPSSAELARYLVFGDFNGPEASASLIAVVEESGSATEVARFGIPLSSFRDLAWRNLTRNKAFRSGNATLLSSAKFDLILGPSIASWAQSEKLDTALMIPLMRSSGPFGLVLLFYPSAEPGVPKFAQDFELFSSILTLGVQLSTQRDRPATESMSIGLLTDRQSQVMSLVSRGFTNKEIAQELSTTVSTVKHEISNILKLLGADSRKMAVELLRDSSDLVGVSY